MKIKLFQNRKCAILYGINSLNISIINEMTSSTVVFEIQMCKITIFSKHVLFEIYVQKIEKINTSSMIMNFYSIHSD